MSHTSRHNKHSDAFWHDRSQNKPEFVPRKGLDEYADAHSSDTSSQGKRHDAIAGGNGTRTTPKKRPALDLAAYRHPDLLAKARTSQNGGAAFARFLKIADRIEREMSPEEIQCELSKYQTQKKKVKSHPAIFSATQNQDELVCRGIQLLGTHFIFKSEHFCKVGYF